MCLLTDSRGAAASDGDDDKGGGDDPEDEGELVEEKDNRMSGQPRPSFTMALSPITIPEHLPVLPLIPIRGNPLFPNFIKMIEVGHVQRVLMVEVFFMVETFKPDQNVCRWSMWCAIISDTSYIPYINEW